MKAYITKHALTRGIEKVEGWMTRHHGNPGFFGTATTLCAPGDWFLFREAAVAHAEDMRREAIAKHEAEIERLRALKFGEER